MEGRGTDDGGFEEMPAELMGGFGRERTGIKGMLPSSMLDWEGKLSTVLFSGGCNLRCPFCHNADLVLKPEEFEDIPWPRIEYHLVKKREWLDGVCLTGGEPTLNPAIERIALLIKELGFPVKLDTNGANPRAIKKLIDRSAIDHVAMDIKTTFRKYRAVSKIDGLEEDIEESIRVLVKADKKGAIIAEFRTTFVPGIVEGEDVLEIAAHLAEVGGRRYLIQQFNPAKVLDPKASRISPKPKEYLMELAEACAAYLPTEVR